MTSTPASSPTPIPAGAIAAPNPTSRAVFRHLVKAVGATNREADTLRHDLLARLEGSDRRVRDLVRALRAIDAADPAGELGAEARLATWFTHAAADPKMDPATSAESGALLAEAWPDASGASPAAMREVARLARASTSD